MEIEAASRSTVAYFPNQCSEKEDSTCINTCTVPKHLPSNKTNYPQRGQQTFESLTENAGELQVNLPFKYPLISGIPDPAAAGAKFVIIYTEDKTRAKLNKIYTRNPAKYELCIILKVKEYFHPAKFSTEILMKTAASPVPEWGNNKRK